MNSILNLINKNLIKLIAICLFIMLIFTFLNRNFYQKENIGNNYSIDNCTYLSYKIYRF